MSGDVAAALDRLAVAVERLAAATETSHEITAAVAEAEATVCPRCEGKQWLGHPTQPCGTCDGLGRVTSETTG